MIDGSSALLRRRYLDLMAGCLCRDLFPEMEPDVEIAARSEGRDWPASAETMIGRRRLDNLVDCLTMVLDNDVPGDLMETGVWRGGATVLMRGALAAWGDDNRSVWVADSFRGLPPPDAETWPADKGVDLSEVEALAVSRPEVEASFARYGLLDSQVRFLEGWFADTLPTAPIERLALLRLDGDLYQSTWEALENLYPKLSVGGILIVDDYGAFEPCRQAVEDYRARCNISDVVVPVDWTGVWWQRTH
ncbi:MAG TPA: macrocin O-methyltransferase [Acidimicrobiaceae bacterium]|nr:macrocin O-methyltransferase [Acidimicrobiaceae bacterium]|tara:strand:+ start:673 stop:1416 length:744 start_codon:yes stop_codon:yes gene_type:complete